MSQKRIGTKEETNYEGRKEDEKREEEGMEASSEGRKHKQWEEESMITSKHKDGKKTKKGKE